MGLFGGDSVKKTDARTTVTENINIEGLSSAASVELAAVIANAFALAQIRDSQQDVELARAVSGKSSIGGSLDLSGGLFLPIAATVIGGVILAKAMKRKRGG